MLLVRHIPGNLQDHVAPYRWGPTRVGYVARALDNQSEGKSGTHEETTEPDDARRLASRDAGQEAQQEPLVSVRQSGPIENESDPDCLSD